MNIVLVVVLSITMRQINAAQPKPRYIWTGDGQSLWSWCDIYTRQNAKTSSEDRFRANFCIGYLNGVIDMEKRAKTPRHFCIPPYMAMGETISEMVEDLKMHADQLNRPAADAAVEALGRAFPGKNKDSNEK
jgi:Ssp1 endopeptidase immunity protein Rap1a